MQLGGLQRHCCPQHLLKDVPGKPPASQRRDNEADGVMRTQPSHVTTPQHIPGCRTAFNPCCNPAEQGRDSG